MSNTTCIYEGMVCQDCLLEIANGERPADSETVMDELPKGQHWVATSTEDTDVEFSRVRCDACYTHLAGSRHSAAILGQEA